MNLIKITILVASSRLDADDLADPLIDHARNLGAEVAYTTHRQTEEAEEWEVPNPDDPTAQEELEVLLENMYPSEPSAED
jgi:hypothetical protein